MKIVQVCLFAFLWTITECLEFKDITENFTCEKIPLAKNQAKIWIQTDVWYVPLWNQGEFYKNALHAYGPEHFANLTEADLENSCVTYTQNGTGFPGYGFGGRTINYEGFDDPLRKGISYFTLPNDEGERVVVVTSYITKTDNKSYTVGTTVWEDDNLKGFFVFATTPKLDESTMDEITTHLIDLGFNPKFFVEMSYENCPSLNTNQ